MKFSFDPKGYQIVQIRSTKKASHEMVTWGEFAANEQVVPHPVFGGGKEGKWVSIYEKQMARFLSVIFCLCMLAYVPQIFPSGSSIAF